MNNNSNNTALENLSESLGIATEQFKRFQEISQQLKDSMPKLAEEFKSLTDEVGKLSETSKKIEIKINDSGFFDVTSTILANFAAIATISTVLQNSWNSFEEKGVQGVNKQVESKMRAWDLYAKSISDSLSDAQYAAKKCSNEFDDMGKSTDKLSKFKFNGFSSMDGMMEIGMKLFDMFSELMLTNEDFAAKVNELWTKIKEAMAPVADAVMSLFDSFTSGGEGTCSMMDTIAGVVASLAETMAGVMEKVVGFFKEHGDTIMAVVSTIWNFISSIANTMIELFGGVFDVITGIFTGNGEKIKEGFAGIWEGIKGIFAGFGDFFSGLWDKVTGVFKTIGARISDAIGGSFKGIINSIIGFAENTINGLIRQINKAIALINEIPGVEIAKIKLLDIPKLELGGMVTPGQLFVAREAGPELVGNFGRYTAVMNNNQIVDAVSRGVYEAQMAALTKAASMNNGTMVIHVHSHLDGRELGREVIKYHNGVVKQTGCSPLLI